MHLTMSSVFHMDKVPKLLLLPDRLKEKNGTHDFTVLLTQLISMVWIAGFKKGTPLSLCLLRIFNRRKIINDTPVGMS